MKRVLVLCLACMILVSTVASAEIIKGTDSFTEGKYISSWREIYPFFKTFHFRKLVTEGKETFEFSISRTQTKNEVLRNAPIEIKVDNYPVFELQNYRYKLTGPDSYGIEYHSIVEIKVETELVDKIKDAKRVAIQYEEANGMRWPYVIPDDVLAEWKEVINTEA